jgi:hypothetical protein
MERELLRRAAVALNDWTHTYASELCDSERVAQAWARIEAAGGTVAYIADLASEINSFLAQPEQKPLRCRSEPCVNDNNIGACRRCKNSSEFLSWNDQGSRELVAYADKIAFEDAMKTGKGCDVWPTAGDYEARTGRKLIELRTQPQTQQERTPGGVNLADYDYDDGSFKAKKERLPHVATSDTSRTRVDETAKQQHDPLPKSESLKHKYNAHKKYPWFCADCGYPEHELLMHTAAHGIKETE